MHMHLAFRVVGLDKAMRGTGGGETVVCAGS